MKTHATGSFEVKSWDEKPYSEIEGQPKHTRADVVYTYHGDFEGEGSIAYLMCYSSTHIPQFQLEEREYFSEAGSSRDTMSW